MAKRCLLKPGQRILFDGDSMTNRRTPPAFSRWPYLKLMNWHETYADQISQWLFCLRPDLNLSFTNAGVGGANSSQLLERFDSFVAPIKPHWVLMTIGGNDQARGMPLPEFRENLLTYAQKLHKVSRGRIAFVGNFPACHGYPKEKASRMAARRRYFRAVAEVARKVDGIYVDVSKPLASKAKTLYKQCPLHTIYSDGGHLNSVGSMIVAMEVIHALGIDLAQH